MLLPNKKTINYAISICVFLLLIKLFTATVALKDDPTKIFVIKHIPSLTNQMTLQEIDSNKFIVLFTDENSILGEKIYYLLVAYFSPFAFFLLIYFLWRKISTSHTR